ncbi:MAG: radical SAM protein [Parachlamydiales bacterium]|jgi:MoaA/NifB/PqqE/SkfB family radical SAM enzyme
MIKFLLRKEYFGGTLFSIKSGKRIYVSAEEFKSLEKKGTIALNFSKEMGEAGDIKIIYPVLLPKAGFSFPDTIFFEVTRECNLHCKYCFNNSGDEMDGEMEFNKQIKIITECADSGVQEVRFTGGEPMVLECLWDLIMEASQNNLRVSMGTNGTLITRESAIKLSLCGLNMAIVSIDGLKKIHDSLRGQGNFLKSINGIRNLREQGIDVRVNIVAMKPNIEDIPRVIEFFHRLGVGVFVRRFISFGRSIKIASDFFLNSNEYEWLKNKLRMYLNDSQGIILGHYLKEESLGTRIQLPFMRHSCSVGQRALVIDPCGKIQLCGFMSQKSSNFFGSIINESLNHVWQRVLAENPAGCLLKILDSYNESGIGMKTNCLAIASAFRRKEQTL